jgi:hypothetical protein
MKVLRTPESQFENLSDYPFKSNYIDFKFEDRFLAPCCLTSLIFTNILETQWANRFLFMVPMATRVN